MSKSNGSTRAGSASSPKALSGTGWTRGEDSFNSPRITSSGEKAAELYYSIQSPVERAVESRVGDIRSGGGFSGPMDNREYSLIFRPGTTNSQIAEYLKGMKEGSKLYAKMNDRSLSQEEYERASSAFEKWYNKTHRG